jgi:hypothetical protein
MKRSLTLLLTVAGVLGPSSPAFCYDDAPEGEFTEAAAPDLGVPPSIEYPPLQARTSKDWLYVDHTYETSSDLSTFSWVTGRGTNDRLALGGMFRTGDWFLAVEAPVQYTRLNIATLQSLEPVPQDRDKATISLGDLLTSASYAWAIATESLQANAGLALRMRVPTHTTQFTFQLAGGGAYSFGFPYYFHLAPGGFITATLGRFTFTSQQALLAMLVKDVVLDGIRQSIPNLFFWESHQAISAQALDWLGLGVELVSCIQLNGVDDQGYTTLHGVKALSINMGGTVALGDYRLALAARLGLTRGAKDLGVITFSGENAYLVRLSRLL